MENDWHVELILDGTPFPVGDFPDKGMALAVANLTVARVKLRSKGKKRYPKNIVVTITKKEDE